MLVQQIFDHGFEGGFRPTYVYTLCGAALALVIFTYLASRLAARRLVNASEQALMALRVRTFEHIHDLSIAEQTEEKRGVFVARVTADVDTLSQFTEWGGIAWIISFALVFGALALMLVYSWQLTIAVVLLVIPLLWVVSSLQGRLTQAFDLVRTRVGQLMSEVSESVMGAAVVRAYGLEERTDLRVKRAIDERYRATIVAHWRSATLFPIATFFYAIAVSVIVWLGASYGPGWGLTFGRVSAFIFLSDVFLHVFTDLPEIYADTQTAIAGWRKILTVLDLPIEIVEPEDGVELPVGPDRGSNERAGVLLPGGRTRAPRHLGPAWNADRTSRSSARRAAGRRRSPSCWRVWPIRRRATSRSTASTSAGCRPSRGAPPSAWFRRTGSCSTPPSARTSGTGGPARATATSRPRSRSWAWPTGSPRSPRAWTPRWASGARPSPSASASWSRSPARRSTSPGLLILDEATSAVDPATERRTTEALRRLSAGRTVITIAHRLSTAEHADRVLVLDAGRLVEEGTHAELLARGGVYAGLHESWLGNTREALAGSGDR